MRVVLGEVVRRTGLGEGCDTRSVRVGEVDPRVAGWVANVGDPRPVWGDVRLARRLCALDDRRDRTGGAIALGDDAVSTGIHTVVHDVASGDIGVSHRRRGDDVEDRESDDGSDR